MGRRIWTSAGAVMIGLVLGGDAWAGAGTVSTAFTWQGRLSDGGVPVEGSADLKFRLYDAETLGGQVGTEQVTTDVQIVDGQLAVDLDFGAVFDGTDLWLEVDVRTPHDPTDTAPFTPLSPRQPINPVPYAHYASNVAAGATPFQFDGADAFFTGGNVGIGTQFPNYALQVLASTTRAVSATNTAAISGAIGVYRETTSGIGGVGVEGQATGGTTSFGVKGISETSGGTGVRGVATHLTGATFGVSGQVSSPDGWAGYFTGGRNYFEGNVGVGTTSPAWPIQVVADGGSANEVGIHSRLTNSIGGTNQSAAVHGEHLATSVFGYGVRGTHAGRGVGVYGTSVSGSGVLGRSTLGTNPLGAGVTGVSENTTGIGVEGFATATTGAQNTGVRGVADGTSGRGVLGTANSTTGDTIGVWGQGVSSSGTGVLGESLALFGNTIGVRGEVNSPTGVAVQGTAASDTGIGVQSFGHMKITGTPGTTGLQFPDGSMQTTAGSSLWSQNGSDVYYDAGDVGIGVNAPAYPLHVEADAGRVISAHHPATSFGATVYATHDGDSGTAVWARSTATSSFTYGVQGIVESIQGKGVYGRANATTGFNWGILGQNYSTGGLAVDGNALATSGVNWGVRGTAESPSGTGVLGWARATTGANYGVHGHTDSPDGYAGYFQGGRNYFEGNVGIGTTSPFAALTIVEGSRVSLDDNADDRAIFVPTGEGEPLVLTNHGGAANPTIRFRNDADNSDAMVVNVNTGKVGIGTTTPDKLFHVQNSATDHMALFENTDPTGFGMIIMANKDPLRVGNAGDPFGNLLIVEDNGQVGIGTTTPGARLDVAGNGRVENSMVVQNPLGGTEGGQLVLGDPGTSIIGEDPNSWNIDVNQTDLRFFRGGGTVAMHVTDAGNVGIGTATPSSRLYVNSFDPNNTAIVGLAGTNPFVGGTGVGVEGIGVNQQVTGVLGRATASISGVNYGVRGETESPDGYAGYFTRNLTGLTTTPTLYVDHPAPDDTVGIAAIEARNDNNPGEGFGVLAYGGTIGVYGDGGGTGVQGVGATGVQGSGGIGGRFTGGTHGVIGDGTTYGVMSLSDGHITGTLSKGGGAFRIDHPLDPENKELWHSFVESPDMKNIYDGVAVLDSYGRAVVELPEYFDALNRDFRYQLTPIGAPMRDLYVAAEVNNNTFEIAGGKPGMNVSWQVTGIRQDPFAEANRIPNEVEKADEDKGKYLHPDVYGAPSEQGVYWKYSAEGMNAPRQRGLDLNQGED